MSNVRASVFFLKEEITPGTPVVPSAATDAVPLTEGGITMVPAVENLDNPELSNDIGMTKGYIGKESPTGTFKAMVKGTGSEGVAPHWSLFLKSAMGASSVAAAEYDTVAASTTTVIKVGAGEAATFEIGEALIIKDVTNGYSIRNIIAIDTVLDQLTLNFQVAVAPALGVNLGKAVLIKPATSGHPTFTAWHYLGNEGAIQMMTGNVTTSTSIDVTAGQQVAVDFSFEGTGFYFDPMTADNSAYKLDFIDGRLVEKTALITKKTYKDPHYIAEEVATKISAASGIDNVTCSFSNTTGKMTLTSDGTFLQLLPVTGTNNTVSAFPLLGITADKTGATTYDGAELSWVAPYVPSYDTAGVDSIIAKKAELFIGDGTDNLCVEASNVVLAVTTTATENPSICSETGVASKEVTKRECQMTCTIQMKRHQAGYFHSFITNKTLSAMVNVGPKDGSSNWVAGKAFNAFLGNCTITGQEAGGDTLVTLALTIKGFVTTTKKDIYFNYV